MTVDIPLLVALIMAPLAVVLPGVFYILKRKNASHSGQLKEAKDALAASQELLRLQYDNAPDMLLSLDVRTQKIIRCNTTLAKKLGYSKTELLGMCRNELYAPACRERAAETFRHFLADGQVHDVELQVLCRDGSVLDVSLSAVQYQDLDGRKQYSDATWRDITQRKK
ncbi:MAG: PAS domain S-box protein, partial [Halieaceae bacterium]|nr:PAS domain S-box protein [Halieaceae bacterium]